jgi:hypothetical protein
MCRVAARSDHPGRPSGEYGEDALSERVVAHLAQPGAAVIRVAASRQVTSRAPCPDRQEQRNLLAGGGRAGASAVGTLLLRPCDVVLRKSQSRCDTAFKPSRDIDWSNVR